MKQAFVIFLLSLLLLPISWNAISLVHYLVEHTHTLCQETTDHAHPNPENCLSVFQLAEKQNQHQPTTTNIEFQELKQYLTPDLLLTTVVFDPIRQVDFVEIAFLNHLFHKDIFYPPISA